MLYFVLMGKSVTRRIAKKQPDLLLFDGHDCVSALKALGEDNRVRITGLLMDSPLGVCEIARRLGSTYYNVSKHLRILREAGLLDVEKHGRERLSIQSTYVASRGCVSTGDGFNGKRTRNATMPNKATAGASASRIGI